MAYGQSFLVRDLGSFSYAIPSSDVKATGGFHEFQMAFYAYITLINTGSGVATAIWHDAFDKPHSCTVTATNSQALGPTILHDFNLTGASINVAGVISWPEKIDASQIAVNAPIMASVIGKVSTSIDGQTVGVAPSTSLGGSAVDPRNIRALTSSDTPAATVTNSVTTDIGSAGTYAKNSELITINATLGTPSQEHSVNTSHGIVEAVHDQGA